MPIKSLCSFWQPDHHNRHMTSADHPHGSAAHHGAGQYAVAVRTHDDDIIIRSNGFCNDFFDNMQNDDLRIK